MSRTGICYVSIIVSVSATTVNAAASRPDTPENAALLYYQAVLSYPEPQDHLAIANVLANVDPNERVREYLRTRSTQETLYLLQVATKIRECNWGIPRSDGYDIAAKAVGQLQDLGRLLDVYARTLTADRKYREALEYCLMLRRFASHMGDETLNTYATSQLFDIRALTCIQHVLSSMPSDPNTLIWLRSQLSAIQGTPWLPARALRGFRDNCVQSVRHNYPNSRAMWREYTPSSSKDVKIKEEMENLTNDEFLARASKAYDDFLRSVLAVIDGDRSYDEKEIELQRLETSLQEQAAEGHPVSVLTGSVCNPSALVLPYYTQLVRSTAYFNATMSAIEIYLIATRTGQLPQMLPSGLPKDPYSTRDFEYQATTDAFVLRSRLKHFNPKFHQYEFKWHTMTASSQINN